MRELNIKIREKAKEIAEYEIKLQQAMFYRDSEFRTEDQYRQTNKHIVELKCDLLVLNKELHDLAYELFKMQKQIEEADVWGF